MSIFDLQECRWVWSCGCDHVGVAISGYNHVDMIVGVAMWI